MSVRTLVKSIQDIMRQDTGVDGDAQRISQLCWMFFLKIIDDQDQDLELTKDGYVSPVPEPYRWRAWAKNPEGMTGDALLAFINDDLFPALKNLQISNGPGDRRRVVRDVFEDAYNFMKSGQLMRQVINKISDVDFNDLTERQHFGDIYEQILNDLQSAGNAGEYYTPRAVTGFMAQMIDPKPGEILFDPACGTGGFLTCALRHMHERHVKRPEDERTMQSALRAVEKKQLPHMLCVTNMLLHGIEDPSFVRHDNTLARPYIGWGQKDRVDIVLTNPPFGGKEEDGIESNFPQHFRTRETADLFLALIVRLLKSGGRAAVVLPDGSLFGDGVKARLKEHLMKECNLHTIVRLPNSVFKPYASIGTNLLFFEKGRPTRDIWFWEHRVPEGQKAYSRTKPIRLEHLQDCIDWWGGAERQGRVENERAWKVTADDVKARGYNLDVKNPHTDNDDHGDPEELLADLTKAEAEVVQIRDQLKAVLTDAKVFSAHARFALNALPALTSRPDQIKILRQTILNLAVRGKLVEQDPTDEPPTRLLKQAREDLKTQAQSTRRMRWTQTNPVSADEINMDLPLGWAAARVNDTGLYINGLAFKPADWREAGIPIVRIQNLTDPAKEFNYAEGDFPDEVMTRNGDLLVSWSATLEAFRWDGGEGVLNQHIFRVIPHEALTDIGFLHLLLRHAIREMADSQHAHGLVMKHINREPFLNHIVYIPPLSEQRRIVAKVDELTTVLDRMETALATTDTTRQHLLNAILHEALTPGN